MNRLNKTKYKDNQITINNQQQQQSIQINQQQQVILNIENIEKYYKLNSQKKLISIIIDKKQSQKVFNTKQVMISSIFQNNIKSQIQKQQQKIIFFAQKYTFQGLADKFPKPKAGTNELLLKILKKKMQKQVITSHQTRKKIWLLASGAKFSMINNKSLYMELLNYTDYPTYFQRSITQDLHRTVNKTTSLTLDQDIDKLKNILTAFSRRNPYIGYCQGLNFIAFFLVTMQFSQQEAFFLLSTMLQSIIPMDYFTNMIGVVCDQQIFINILKVKRPKITDKFQELGLDPNILSIQWFVCLFTSSLPFYLVKIVWDKLLVQGTVAFIKTGLIILSYFQDVLLETTQFHQIIFILEKGSKNLKISQVDFNAEFQNYYIDPKGLKLARDLYREYYIKQKLSQKIIDKKRKKIDSVCDVEWPICAAKLDMCKRERQQIDVWIYRTQNPPRIIRDYLQNLPKNFQKDMNMNATIVVETFNQSKIQKQKKNSSLKKSYTINKQSKVSTNQNEQQILNKLTSEQVEQKQINSKQRNIKSQITNIYQNDEKVSPSKSSPNMIRKNHQKKQKQKTKNEDLIIGRMNHVCINHATSNAQPIKVKKNRKNQIKYLSMILQEDVNSNREQIQQKKQQNLRKINRYSQMNAQNNGQPTQLDMSSLMNDQKLSKDEREILARSRTINFYTQFMQKNKQLSSIISGIQSKHQNDNQKIDSQQNILNNSAIRQQLKNKGNIIQQ